MGRRRRWALAPLGGALLVAAVGVAANRSDLVVLDRFGDPATTWLVFWTLLAVAAWLFRPRRRTVAIGALPVVAVAALTGFASAVSSATAITDARVVRRLTTPAYEIRLVQAYGIVDPLLEVRVRTRAGLLSRERTVWGAEIDSADADIRLTGPRTVEVTVGGRAPETVTF